MEKINLVIDVDDTITCSSKKVLEHLNVKYGMGYKEEDIYQYDFLDLFPKLTKDKLNEIFELDDFYTTCGVLDGSIEAIERFSNCSAYKVHICTIGTQQNLLNKYNWIIYNIKGDINIIGLTDVPDKGNVNMANSIQIDDRYEDLIKTNAKVKILLTNGFDREYNKVKPNDEIYVVDNWNQINEILSFCEQYPEEFLNV